MEDVKKADKIESHEIIDVELEKSDLETLKEAYAVLKKEYDLPDFDSLNEDFQLEKLQSEDTDFLIREVRRYIVEKFSSYLRLIETLLQPSNAQMFVFAMLKSINSDDNKMLQALYRKLAKKEIEVIALDLKHNVEAEAEFIKTAYELWQEVREELLVLIEKIKDNWSLNGEESSRDRAYFG
ncbi:MAG: hypothetical protein PF487_11825 [Bacteroidales bacterium]|jgi:3'-phosphoadenosine 5'-phosphosulfate sulfotransferase (PAPS reductase)/FAD synthetase|nr:hypothetical protein [Bacteroidales bacterium]